MNKLFLVRDIIGLSLLPSPPFPPLRFRFASKIPLHLYPESPPKLHPNVQLNAPAPRIESRIFLLLKAQGDGASNSPHHLKVANPSASVAESSPARAGAQRSEREKGGDFAPAGSKGRSPWRFFGDFLIGEKVTRGGGAERPRIGECRGGFAPSHIVGRRDLRPCKIPRGVGRSARSRGEQRGNAPRIFGVCRGLAPAPAPRGDAAHFPPYPRG